MAKGLLTLAGVISGAGKAAQASLAQGQRYLGIQAIQERRHKLAMRKAETENEWAEARQAKQLEHDKAIQQKDIKSRWDIANLQATTQLEGINIREAGLGNRLDTRLGAEAQQQKERLGHEKEQTQARVLSAEKIAQLQADTQKDVAALRESGLSERLTEQIRSSREELILKLNSAETEGAKERLMLRQMQDERERGLDLRQIRDHAHRLKEVGLLSDAAMARLDKELGYKREEGQLTRDHEKALQDATLEAAREKVVLVPRADGTIVKMQQDGTVVGTVMDPDTKKPLQGPKDLNAATKVLTDAIISRMQGNVKRMSQVGLLPEEIADIKAENEQFQRQLEVILGTRKPRPPFRFPDFGTAPATQPAAPTPSTPGPRAAPPAAPRRTPSGILSMEEEQLRQQFNLPGGSPLLTPGQITVEPRR